MLAVEACAKRADVAGIAKVQRADVCISAARRDCLFVYFFAYGTSCHEPPFRAGAAAVVAAGFRDRRREW